MNPRTRIAQRPRHGRVVFVIAMLIGLLAAFPQPALGQTTDDAGMPITNRTGQSFAVVAHRGGMADWPENSLEAYQSAASAGFDAIEADIVFTKDLQPVMTHYDHIQPGCTGAGLRIHTLTWAQVSQLRCPDLTGAQTVPLPSFAELADVLTEHPEVTLFLDIKSYTGQSAAGRRNYARWSVELVKRAGLLERTRFTTFSWSQTLPTLRKYAPSAYLVAYDHAQLSFANAKRAAQLGADAYGPELRYATAPLAHYVRSLGMAFNPWRVTSAEGLASAIFFGPKELWLLTDAPGKLQQQLRDGVLELNPRADVSTRVLPSAVTVGAGTYRAKKRHYPTILGKAVARSDEQMLETVDVRISLSGLKAKATLYLGGRGTSYREVKLSVGKKTKTVTAKVIMGDGGKLRIWCDHTVKLKVQVTGYSRLRFSAGNVTATALSSAQ